MFSGKAAPYQGFGGVIQVLSEIERQLHVEAAQTREEVQKTFRSRLEPSESVPKRVGRHHRENVGNRLGSACGKSKLVHPDIWLAAL